MSGTQPSPKPTATPATVINNITNVIPTPSPLPSPSPSPTPDPKTLLGWPPGVAWKDIAGQVLQILAGVVAGSIAWYQFERAHRQRQEQYDRKERQDQFVDIQNRLASDEPSMRASAALRLAEFGKTLKLGVRTWRLRWPICRSEAKRLPWRWQNPIEHFAPPFNAENNPFFEQSVAQLATALHFEKDSNIRATIREALELLIKFAQSKEIDPLRLKLIEEVRDANLEAKRAFIRSFGQYMAIVPHEQVDKELQNLAIASRFCSKAIDTRAVLESLMMTSEYNADSHVFGMFSEEITEVKTDKSLFSQLQQAAAILVDTRIVLERALAKLAVSNQGRKSKSTFRGTNSPLNLNACFLAGSDLQRVQLQGAQLQGAQLQGANLRGAQLQGAQLQEAGLQGARLLEADLQEANLRNADLKNAKLMKANLHETILQGADLKNANLYKARLNASIVPGADTNQSGKYELRLRRADLQGADLQSADLGRARLQGANLRKANLREANLTSAKISSLTCLYDIYVGDSNPTAEETEYANFVDTNLFDSNFKPRDPKRRSPEADEHTKQVKEWLERTFPSPKQGFVPATSSGADNTQGA